MSNNQQRIGIDDIFVLALRGMAAIKADGQKNVISWMGELPTREELGRAILKLGRAAEVFPIDGGVYVDDSPLREVPPPSWENQIIRLIKE